MQFPICTGRGRQDDLSTAVEGQRTCTLWKLHVVVHLLLSSHVFAAPTAVGHDRALEGRIRRSQGFNVNLVGRVSQQVPGEADHHVTLKVLKRRSDVERGNSSVGKAMTMH